MKQTKFTEKEQTFFDYYNAVKVDDHTVDVYFNDKHLFYLKKHTYPNCNYYGWYDVKDKNDESNESSYCLFKDIKDAYIHGLQQLICLEY